MEEIKLWKKGVVYQIYPRSFMDSNGDGIGDIPGITSKLDYLKELGVDIIWLSPVYKSPNDDNGYDISDYKDINPEYGTMEDMDHLIDEAGKKGLKIIMDLVINHTSDEHPWFIASKNKDSKYRDYYIWRDKPNNWTSFFSGPAWSKDKDSYYLHLFSKKQPDLNWDNPEVMKEIQDIMHYWLKKGIYGFRCDVINIIYKSSLENGKKRLVLTGKEHYHSQEGCHKILRTLRKEVLDSYDCFTVGETVMVDTKQANDLILPERKELDMVFGFEHMETDQINNKWFKTKFNPNKFMRVISKWQQEVYWNANYMENHDQPRSVSRFGNDKEFHRESAKMLATLNLTLKGTPYIFEGEEIGMTNCVFNSMSEFKDVESHNIDALAKKLMFPKKVRFKMISKTSRDNARTPMQWTKDGGFSSGKSWLKMNPNQNEINVDANLFDKNSIYYHYKTLIHMRKHDQVLINGNFKPLFMGNGIFIFSRNHLDETYITVSNMTKKVRKIPILLEGKILLSNVGRNDMTDQKLLPYESILIKRGV
ncbi:MAG TPA: glucohydrolase [Acholeplasmataceae bacterium]|nr:MAG: glucohydrolase [Tenericutes bacterium GWE2_38_8]HBY64959.1 glucohydrolase [Acholeplasmataceae bacterium]